MINPVELNLPHDCRVLNNQPTHRVYSSRNTRRVYRVAPSGSGDFSMSIRGGHYKAAELAERGLNVLPPTEMSMSTVQDHDISVFPLAIPLESVDLVNEDWVRLGEDMSEWTRHRPHQMEMLDIPGYASDRADKARQSPNSSLAEAGWICQYMIKKASLMYPYEDLIRDPGLVHGDPHVGNMVKMSPEGRILFIDVDYVKIGPKLFDLAVSHMYRRRYNSLYPADLIQSGFPTEMIDEQTLRAAAEWKEISSYTQLLERWNQIGVSDEFFRRLEIGWEESWIMMTGTPAYHHSFSS